MKTVLVNSLFLVLMLTVNVRINELWTGTYGLMNN